MKNKLFLTSSWFACLIILFMYSTIPEKQKRAKYRLLMVLIVPFLTCWKNDLQTNLLMFLTVIISGILECIRNNTKIPFQPPRFTSILISTVFIQIMLNVLLYKYVICNSIYIPDSKKTKQYLTL